MMKTASIACAALMLTAAAAPALALESTRTAQGSGQYIVRLCDVDALSQPAFRNVDGARPVFVTADEVLSARATGERWTSVRCMTPVQHQRLTQRMSLRHAAMASAPRSDARF